MKGLKEILASAAGLVLCLAYLWGVVGVDIHVDHHEGRIYVVSLLSDTSCEKIHPEDVCHCCEHHHHHEADGICPEEDDCQDIADFLVITGDGYDSHLSSVAPAIGAAFNLPTPSYAASLARTTDLKMQPKPLTPLSPGDHLSQICVLRV